MPPAELVKAWEWAGRITSNPCFRGQLESWTAGYESHSGNLWLPDAPDFRHRIQEGLSSLSP